MGHNQPMQSSSNEQFVRIPVETEPQQNSDSNQRRNKWLTIIICIILAVTGQSVVRLLENYYFLHRTRKYRYGPWTLSLLQFVGFPILLIPFVLLHLPCNKKKQLIMTSEGISPFQLAIFYPVLAFFMFFQAMLSNLKNAMPFRDFTLTYTTQLLFTPYISSYINKTKFNRWMIISLSFAIITGSFTLNTFFAGSPGVYTMKKQKFRAIYAALIAAFVFSLTLCLMRSVFDSICTVPTNKKQPSFAVVLELLIVSSLVATLISLAAVFISGEHHGFKRRMDGFSKGEAAYVWTLVGQAVAWQVYWVGIVGLMFAVSAVFSNVISVCTWPIVSLLVAVFYSTHEQYNALSGTALATAALSVASYFYMIHKDKSESDEATN
ncbi:unnamed protein product [Eruca vesicaria subsp. sativa]|uniref:Probable purine permease n=1 Tax=Eruca vesicaria subsp. sativa TaxID=29727 RepID=A0ABC8LI26_ERUVS|nr:unnamed protein product [Eruca vesicaria subsp. sativa]